MDPALRRLGRVLLGIATVLLGIVALAGVVVVVLTSTDWGHERVRRFALGQLQSRVHGRVSIGRLSGNLLSGLTIHDLAISDSTGEPFLAAQEVSARYGLGALIGKKIWLQDVRLVRPLIVLDRPPGGKWNYQRIFVADTTQQVSTGPGFGSWIKLENVTVVDGDLVVRTPWSPGDKLSRAARDPCKTPAVLTRHIRRRPCRAIRVLNNRRDRAHKRERHRPARNRANQSFGEAKLSPQEAVDRRARKRQDWDEP